MEDRLQKFAALVDAESFTKAAEVLHISQPALSAAIAKLERELGSTLISRGSKPPRLTPAGEAAYRYAKSAAVQSSNLRRRISQLAHEQRMVRLGMIDSLVVALFELGYGLDDLEHDVAPSLIVKDSHALMRAVELDELDAAFLVAQPVYPDILGSDELGAEPMLLVCHPALLRKTERMLGQGRLQNFVNYIHTSTTSSLIQQEFANRRINLQTTFYSTSPEVIRELVLAQKGVAVLPYLLVRDQLRQKRLALVAGGGFPLIRRHIAVVRHPARELPRQVITLAGHIQETLEILGSEVAHIL